MTTRPTSATCSASAPAKVILLGEHSVNRGQPALATAIDARVSSRVTVRPGGRYRLGSMLGEAGGDLSELGLLEQQVDGLRTSGSVAEIASLAAKDTLAPIRYVLGQLVSRFELPGVDVDISSRIPVGAGFGSGAAVACSLAAAVAGAYSRTLAPEEIVELAWSGDVVAHGGVASALDSSAAAHGGVIRYSSNEGAVPLKDVAPLELVIANTGVVARTAQVNARLSRNLDRDPALGSLFKRIGGLVADAEAALCSGDRSWLANCMNENQELLSALGVSSPAIDQLVTLAVRSGALGAKLSGSGGGGIVIVVCQPGEEEAVAGSIRKVGLDARVYATSAVGAHPDPITQHQPKEMSLGNSR